MVIHRLFVKWIILIFVILLLGHENVVYRDRERKFARYNQLRRALLLIPISKWEDLTDDKEAIQALGEVHGDDVEKLDLLVGLMAEKKIKGFYY